MELPPLDHVGWGRLLSAVMESDAADETPVRRTSETRVVDMTRFERRIHLARTSVEATGTDVYA